MILSVGAVICLSLAFDVGYYAGYKHGHHRSSERISVLRDVTDIDPFQGLKNTAGFDQYFTPRNSIPGEFKR